MRTQTRYIQTRPHRGDDLEERETTTYESDASVTAARVVYAITGILIGMVSLRFLFLLLGANASNAIAQVVYGLTQPLVAPFYGLFGTRYAIEGVRLELESVMAILFISFIAWAVVKLLTVSKTEQV